MERDGRVDKRIHERTPILKKCVLANGFGSMSAFLIDRSESGLGIMIKGLIPFKQDDKLIVSYEISNSWCQVAWIKKIKDTNSTVGLKLVKRF